MMEAVLTCSALTKAYGPNKALDNFTAVFSGGRITGPVSYTHLDVYKRQLYIRSCAACIF